MYIIPAIDVIDGRCVRLTQGDYQQSKTYYENPVEVAKMFEQAGISRLHLVDLDGARLKKVHNIEVLRQICQQTSLQVDFGGGVQSDADLELVLQAGAQQITGGSIAVKQPEVFSRWLSQYGTERIILGADARNGRIAISGWQESSELMLSNFIEEYMKKGVSYVICTEISRDGLMQGPALELYNELLQQFPSLKLIASGGVSSLADLEKLASAGLYGAIVGKAIYEGAISLDDISRFQSA
jgi:phosphoribosylformimino-5-aminoimidazole carboxamide ribotide isomerase